MRATLLRSLILYRFFGELTLVLGERRWKDCGGLRIEGTASLPWKDVPVGVPEGDGRWSVVRLPIV